MSRTESSRRVVVTGLGAVTSLGAGLPEFWQSCLDGRSGLRAATEADVLPVSRLAPADSFTGSPDDFCEPNKAKTKAIRKGLKLMSREIQMGVACAQRALNDAKITEPLPSLRTGVSFASDFIVTPPFELQEGVAACLDESGKALRFSSWPELGISKMNPLWQLKYLTNMSASHITIYNEFYGPAFDITNREASFAAALAEAASVVASGRADYMIVGSTGTRLHPWRFADALKYGEISPDILPGGTDSGEDNASRPFDARRNGVVPGEGAGAIFIETAETALAAGREIYAEIVGGAHRGVVRHSRDLSGAGCDIAANTETLRESFGLTLRALKEKTGLDASSTGHVNANARGDRDLDAAEALALRDFFGDALDDIPVVSLKGHLGNPGAGSGAIEMIASLLALRDGVLFPTLGYAESDPLCPVIPSATQGVPAGDSFLKLCANSIGQTSAVFARKFAG